MKLLRKHYLRFLLFGVGGWVLLYLLPFDLSAARGQTRSYYIAAEDVLWDYAPSYPTNLVTGQEFTEDQKVFVEADGKTRIGR
ncbi:MAG: hypothetical protein ACREYE_30230, partial [Gammaproteobacteria bacterium]